MRAAIVPVHKKVSSRLRWRGVSSIHVKNLTKNAIHADSVDLSKESATSTNRFPRRSRRQLNSTSWRRGEPGPGGVDWRLGGCRPGQTLNKHEYPPATEGEMTSTYILTSCLES